MRGQEAVSFTVKKSAAVQMFFFVTVLLRDNPLAAPVRAAPQDTGGTCEATRVSLTRECV